MHRNASIVDGTIVEQGHGGGFAWLDVARKWCLVLSCFALDQAAAALDEIARNRNGR
ncbi:cytochrome oxidase subunit I [Ahrensia sp. R2A130]|nr:cytochrome oxidase subunit I [Ahrensia sp. R2A130]